LKTKALDIVKIANLTKAIDTKYFEIKNEDKLNIKIIRSKELNLGYLLGKLSYLDIVSMDIFKLFDNFKLFDITFGDMVDEQSLSALETIINDSFDMDKKIELIKPVILKDEVSINQNHTDELISFKIQTKNQKGLFSYIADLLDTYKIEIQSAKLHTVGKKVNDLLLIERNDNFILNQDEIINKICVQSSKLHSKSSH
jgi:[protein-PII] uridylyltransferase